MKKLLLFLALTMFSYAQAQIVEPVKWTASVKKISATEYELIATATIEKGWHLYSQTVAKDGPVATSFTFQGNNSYLKKGNTSEEKGHTVKDPIFNMQIKYFENKATFKQRVKLKSKPGFKVNATVEFMVCDNSRCLPPSEEDLVFNIK
ncbi:protein-disulfide reductase DsbD domain-containing protein [Flavobacterium sp. LC2016-12]|uniref:protein-disulfide reductase DsbD domain-containing protein n=1 Tax=Flavobacterium sp. LC2016-12 TaxID=2783794 RepID=UPI001889E4C2|nr:protein-disulfide reductase DsbD domain-containing protein [Flavobacterium sp. LC2016-12]MBF4464977.1 cytochrome C biogenesis protein [Flavobacterium sp. LC2016-12]